MKRKPSDLQTVPSESMMNLTDYGMRVDSYIPQQRDIKHWDTRNSHNRFSGGVTSPQSCHSEDLSYRNGNVHGNLTEINNNKLSKNSGSRMYSSHMDIYRTPPTLSYIKENSENCIIRSDEMYSDKSVKNASLNSNDPESVSRAHSVGDLSTGLTFSVVGQRKADSIQTPNNSSFKPVAIDNGNVKKSTGKTYPTTSDPKRKESARKCAENKKDLQNTLRDLLTNISETKERECAKTQNANSNSNKRDTTTTPIKPKRALPSVPQGQVDDRKKHYTEMVKIRMSEHSRNGQSSSSGTSSSVRTVLDTPLDKEVSDYLGNDRESCPGMLENVQFNKENNGNISHRKGDNLHHDTLNVSIPLSVRSCDSGQATITSLSSTVDSGYLTNEAENDMYSSVSYTKCLQKSAQNFYSKKTPVVHSQSLHNESTKHLQESVKSAKHIQESAKHLQESTKSAKQLQESAKGAKYLQESAIPVPGHLRNERTTISFKEKDNNSGMRTFPRSGHSTSISNDNYLESIASKVIQETQKSKLKVCDKPMKYSSMKQLPTSDLMAEGQRLQQPKSQGQNMSVFKSEIDELKQINKNEVINVKTKVAKTVHCESSPQTEGEGQIPVTESHYNTLPGNWKYQNNQNLNDNSVKRLPSLHQLSQTYRFIPVTLSIGLEYNILDHLHLCENCVMLQNTKKTLKRESPAMSPPQGKYARLGGPGSAFKPVKVSDTSMYSVISVKEVSNVFHHKILQKGDILIEVCNCLLGEGEGYSLRCVIVLISGVWEG